MGLNQPNCARLLPGSQGKNAGGLIRVHTQVMQHLVRHVAFENSLGKRNGGRVAVHGTQALQGHHCGLELVLEFLLTIGLQLNKLGLLLPFRELLLCQTLRARLYVFWTYRLLRLFAVLPRAAHTLDFLGQIVGPGFFFVSPARQFIDATLRPLGAVLLLPLLLLIKSASLGWQGFWDAVTAPRVLASYQLTFGASLLAALVNLVFGTIVAWVLVRYRFPGKKITLVALMPVVGTSDDR